MWVVANDFEKPKQKLLIFLDDFTASKEEYIIAELDDKFWELWEYDPEGYDWKELTAADLPDDLTYFCLNEKCYYNWEVK